MADIAMQFTNPTPSETRAANYELQRINAIRVAHGEEEFETVKDMIVYNILNQMLPEWINREANARRQEINLREKYRDATADQREIVEDVFDATEQQITDIQAILNPEP